MCKTLAVFRALAAVFEPLLKILPYRFKSFIQSCLQDAAKLMQSL